MKRNGETDLVGDARAWKRLLGTLIDTHGKETGCAIATGIQAGLGIALLDRLYGQRLFGSSQVAVLEVSGESQIPETHGYIARLMKVAR